MTTLGVTKIWGRGYTTVPTIVRKLLEADNGDEITWFFEDNNIIIRKTKTK